jgi:hypothetical protein
MSAATMSPSHIAEVMARPIAQQLVTGEPLLRVSYTGLDGGPRVIPVGYLWDGTSFVFWTIPDSAKVRALDNDPRCAIVIDVAGPPPRLLMARGRAELARVPGVPDGYLEASHRTMPAQAWAGFDAQVSALYDSMTAITVTPTWVKLIDFETNAPSAVEKLVASRSR